MSDIQQAINEHKSNCQELQHEKFKHIEITLERMDSNINKLLESAGRNDVLENRVTVTEELLKKQLSKAIAIIGFILTVLLALYVLVPKIAGK